MNILVNGFLSWYLCFLNDSTMRTFLKNFWEIQKLLKVWNIKVSAQNTHILFIHCFIYFYLKLVLKSGSFIVWMLQKLKLKSYYFESYYFEKINILSQLLSLNFNLYVLLAFFYFDA